MRDRWPVFSFSIWFSHQQWTVDVLIVLGTERFRCLFAVVGIWHKIWDVALHCWNTNDAYSYQQHTTKSINKPMWANVTWTFVFLMIGNCAWWQRLLCMIECWLVKQTTSDLLWVSNIRAFLAFSGICCHTIEMFWLVLLMSLHLMQILHM